MNTLDTLYEVHNDLIESLKSDSKIDVDDADETAKKMKRLT